MKRLYKKPKLENIPLLWNHDPRQYLRGKGGTMKLGGKVQVWDEEKHKPLGWGTIIKVAYSAETKEGIPLIELESGKTIWGDRCDWIEEKKACEIGVRLFRDIHKRPGS